MTPLEWVATTKTTRLAAAMIIVAVVFISGRQQQWPVLVAAAASIIAAYMVHIAAGKGGLLPLSVRLAPPLVVALTMATMPLVAPVTAAITLVLWSTTLLLLLRTVGSAAPQGLIFCAFLAVSIGSVMSVVMLIVVPLLWLIVLFAHYDSPSRCLAASICGVLLPYFFWAIALLYTRDTAPFLAHFAPLFPSSLIPDSDDYTPLLIAIMVGSSGLNIISAIHYWYHRRDKSIFLRTTYYTLHAITTYLLVAVIALPQHADTLFWLAIPPLALTTTALLAPAATRR